jgi:thiosulfate dehydrogenase (quinone) large subunit
MKNQFRFDPQAAAVALGRWMLGFIFLFYGLGKLPDIAGFARMLALRFESTWLPGFLVLSFGFVLPVIEVALGALLLVGLARNGVLFATGLLLIALAFGQVVLRDPAVVFYNTVYLFLTASLLFAGRYDRWTIPVRQVKTHSDGSSIR